MSLPLVIALALAICAAGHEVSLDQRRMHACGLKDPLMNPIHEVLHGQDTVWQIPNKPKAILFLAHGVSADPFSYFDRSPGCEQCYGLPEDRAVVLDALRRGYAVISVKSIGARYDSWPLETSQDLMVVGNILHEWKLEHSLDNLPWVLFGVSAGGFFATSLATRIPTFALILMCSQGHSELMNNATPETFPPTFFVYMGVQRDAGMELADDKSVILSESLGKLAKLGVGSRAMLLTKLRTDEDAAVAKLVDDSMLTVIDTTTKEVVEEAMAILSERGVQVDGKCSSPRPVTPYFFTERIPCMTGDASEKIQRAYKADGWLDGENYLTLNPRGTDWTAPLQKSNALPVWYEPVESGECSSDVVCQELMKAYAFHVTTADANEAMYSWVDSLLAFSDIPTNIEEFHASQ